MQTFSETYDGSGALSASWASFTGNKYTRQSDQAGPVTTAAADRAQVTGITFLPTQFAQITLKVLPPADGSQIYLMLRTATNGSACYFATINSAGYSIYKSVSYGNTIIGSAHSQTFVANDVVRVEIDGTTFRFFRNGTLLTSVDVGTDTATGSIGAGFYTAGTNLQARFDDFTGGDLARVVTVSSHTVPVVNAVAALTVGRRITAAVGAVPAPGQAAVLRYSRNLIAGAGSAPVTGKPVTLGSTKRIQATAAAAPISGQVAGLRVQRTLSGTTAAVAVAQASALVRRGYTLYVGQASVPVGVGGALLNKGLSASWDTMTALRSGVLKNSPLEFNSLGAGTWLFGIKMRDSSGNESQNAKFITVTLPPPRISGSVAWQDAGADGWPGATSDVEPISGVLLPQPAPYAWSDLTSWATWRRWSAYANVLVYPAEVIDTGSIQALNVYVDAEASEGATMKIENRTSNNGTAWSAWEENVSVVTCRYVQTRVTATGEDPRLLRCVTVLTKG